MPNYLRGVKAVAELLGCTVKTVYNLRKRGLPCKVVSHKLILFNPDEVVQWVDKFSKDVDETAGADSQTDSQKEGGAK